MKRNIQLKQFCLCLFVCTLLMSLLTGCDGEKDLKIIDGNLPIKTSTGIQGVVQTDGEPFDVFNLSGQKVKSNATSLEGLPRGIYIVKGKKVIN